MKILHVSASPLKITGGIPVVLKNLVAAQNEIEGITAKVASLISPVDAMKSVFFDYVPNAFSDYIDGFCPDVVILHGFYYYRYNMVVNTLNAKGIRYYIEPHGSFVKAGMRKSWLKKTIANNTIFRKQLKNAFGYIFLNESERCNSCYITPNDIIIPNGININTNISKKPKKNSMYYIGRYDIKEKGIDFLISALDLLEKEKKEIMDVQMWGKGNASEEKNIKKMIKNFSYLNVNCNGPIIGEEKDIKLEQLGPMILTSRHEGMPMSILEAWAYGNPVIVTPETNMAAEVEANKLGWVTKLNPKCIAATIEKAVMEYKTNKDEYIRRCKDYVTNNYSWQTVAQLSYSKLSNSIL